MTNLKLKSPVPFPASVQGAGGIKVSKSGGIWTIEPGFDDIASVVATAISDPTSKQIWIFDPTTLDYNVLTLAGLGDALYKTTSTTSLAIGTGSKTFTVQSGKDITVGDWVLATSDSGTSNFMLGQVTSYSGTSLVVNVINTGGSGTKSDWTVRLSASSGAQGKSSGNSYLWNTSTSAADPGSGKIAADNATFASITTLYLSETDNDGNAISALIATWVSGTSVKKGRIKISDPVSPSNFMTFDLTGYIDSGTYVTLTVTPITNGGSFSASEALYVSFSEKGDKGDLGGIPWLFATSTTMADPSAGNIRLNNATLSSVTEIAISADSADTGNPSYSAYINTWDDSSNSAHRGTLTLRKNSAPQNEVIFDITGALTDNTTWLQVPVSYISSNGSFSASDQLAVSFYRSGDKGVDGSMTGPGASVDGEVALFSGTGGTTLKRATGSGIVKLTSGVQSIATAGTDYQAADAQLKSIITINSKSAAYTTVLTDGGLAIYHPSSDNNARTFTIDSNANVAYPVGTTLTFINEINTVTIAITTDTLTLMGTGSTGSRTLSANGIATAVKVAATKWVISGINLS